MLLGGMALFKEVCRVESGFEVIYAQATSSVVYSLLMLPADQDVELPAPSPALCMPAHCHAPIMMIMG